MTAFTLTLDVAPRPPHHGISDDSSGEGRKERTKTTGVVVF